MNKKTNAFQAHNTYRLHKCPHTQGSKFYAFPDKVDSSFDIIQLVKEHMCYFFTEVEGWIFFLIHFGGI